MTARLTYMPCLVCTPKTYKCYKISIHINKLQCLFITQFKSDILSCQSLCTIWKVNAFISCYQLRYEICSSVVMFFLVSFFYFVCVVFVLFFSPKLVKKSFRSECVLPVVCCNILKHNKQRKLMAICLEILKYTSIYCTKCCYKITNVYLIYIFEI